jgi:DNA-directed RNA polymerase specialized sigma24 family protein
MTSALSADCREIFSRLLLCLRWPEEAEAMHGFIEKSDELNKALVLLYLDGNSYAEIAGVLGISETNVATKINRLKNSMKQEFSSRQAR